MTEDQTLLGQEWQTLQANHEQYEKSALLIKLTCLVLSTASLAFGIPLVWIAITIALCWLQDGIFKTFQSRLADRLLRIEAQLRQPQSPQLAMQLHSEWLSSRPGTLALVIGYIASAGRPTVAFPYLPLLLLLGFDGLLPAG
jgi:hypothetical protein